MEHYCYSCHTTLSSNGNFCQNCGIQIYCLDGSCKTKLVPNSNFCHNCGFSTRIRCIKQTKKIGAPLIKWLKENVFHELDWKLQRLFENAFVEWGNMSFWFGLVDIAKNSKIPIGDIRKMIHEANPNLMNWQTMELLRFANSDTWTFCHDKLKRVLHAHLKVILADFLK